MVSTKYAKANIKLFWCFLLVCLTLFQIFRPRLKVVSYTVNTCLRRTSKTQKQPSIGALTKQLKLQSKFIEIILRHGCFPVNLLYIFITPFSTNTSQGQLLKTKDVFRILIFIFYRSSHRRCSLKKSVPRNSAKFTGKHLRQSHF